MSREVTEAEQLAKGVVRWVWGTAVSIGVLTTAALLAVHIVRKLDAGMVHLPWNKAPLYLGVPPQRPLQPAPPLPKRPPNLVEIVGVLEQ